MQTRPQQDSLITQLTELQKFELIIAHIASGKAFQLDLLQSASTAASTEHTEVPSSMQGTKRRGGGPRKSDIVMSPDFPSEDLVMSASPFRESEGCSSTMKSLRDQSGKASTQRPQLVSGKDPTTPDKGDLRLIRTPCCGGGSFYKLVDSLQFTHSPKKIPIPVLITPKSTSSSKILSRKKTAHRQKRKQWKPEEFNQLRSQSLLGFHQEGPL
ncbi:hypothetical protein FGO68_gene16277 [Halteria grandinella]|uniref:Uncharacterized protein n=1 Tax=Halteria grandinella TaxID=5974 RepID=A0A8J8NC84_HALGN|nr:hypothetical protein FGO68_gene16277 [Halteria grandinella]